MKLNRDSVKIRGLIARNLEEQYSRKMAHGSLEEYLIKNNIVCIEDIDTRALVTHVRQKGAMNCIISSEITRCGGTEKRAGQSAPHGRS